MGSPPGSAYDPVIRNRRYVLGETDDFFGIWERGAAGEPIDRFPLTAEGFEEAKDRLKELRRASRPSLNLQRAIFICLVVGVTLWILAGLLGASFWLFGPPGPGDWAYNLGISLEAIGFPLAVGMLAILAGLAFIRRSRFAEADLTMPAWPQEALARLLGGLVAIGLLLWVAGSVALLFLPPDLGFGPTGFGVFLDEPVPSNVYRITQSITAIAFRVWVAGLVGFLLFWIRGPHADPET